MNRIRRPRAEYEALLARKESEHLTYKQLAAEAGIPESTLVLWLGRLKKERRASAAFVEVHAEPTRHSGVEIVLENGHRIAVDQDFDEHVLRRVVAALEC
jgi:hypothetical protein